VGSSPNLASKPAIAMVMMVDPSVKYSPPTPRDTIVINVHRDTRILHVGTATVRETSDAMIVAHLEPTVKSVHNIVSFRTASVAWVKGRVGRAVAKPTINLYPAYAPAIS
jgi:hypothetical protein